MRPKSASWASGLALLSIVPIGTTVLAGPPEPPDVSIEPIDVNAGPTHGNPSDPVVWNGQLFFSAHDGFACSGVPPGEIIGDELGEYGREVFTAGINTGPLLVKDINLQTSANCDGVNSSFGEQAAPLHDALIFRARPLGANDTGFEPWRTQGTPETTEIVRDINFFTNDSDPSGFATVLGGSHVAFGATTGFLGTEPWITDGTQLGTVHVGNIAVDDYDSDPYGFTPLSSTQFVFIASDDDVLDHELYVSNGSTSAFVKDINPEPNDSSDPQFLTHFVGRNKVVFFAFDETAGQEPWVTDGTAGGTLRLADINPGSASSNDDGDGDNAGFVQLGNLIYFSADDGTTGRELWVTDGTPGGTHMVTEVVPGLGGGYFAEAAVFQGLLYFEAPGRTIWTSDGTAPGTSQVIGNIFPGGIGELTAVGDLLYFRSSDELWASDGTVDGTVSVGSFDTRDPVALTAVNSSLLAFWAGRSAVGTEMFLAYPISLASDTTPPEITNLNVSPNPVMTEVLAFVDVSASELATGGNHIISIEYRIDGGSWFEMIPTDGAYDEPTEVAREPIVFDAGGTFPVCARATDGAYNTSSPSCVDVEVNAPEPTLRLRAIEVNQAIQNWRLDVPLYQYKDTVARVFLEKIDPLANEFANGLLYGWHGGQALPGSPLSVPDSASVGDDVTAFMLIDDDDADTVADDVVVSYRADLAHSLDFLLPASWIDQAGTTDLEFELTFPTDGVLECAEPAGEPNCRIGVEFEPSAQPLMDFFAIPYDRNHIFELEVDATDGEYTLISAGRESDPIPFNADTDTVQAAAKDVFNAGKNRVKVLCVSCASGVREYEIHVLRGAEESLQTNSGDLMGGAQTATVTTSQVGGPTIKPTQKQMQEQARRVVDVFPINRIDYRFRDTGDFNRAPGLFEVNTRLALKSIMNHVTDYLGIGHTGITSSGYLLGRGPDAGGLAFSGQLVSSSYASGSEAAKALGYSRNRSGHEVAHVYGRPHAVTRFHTPPPATIPTGKRGICNAKGVLTTAFHPFIEDTGIENPDRDRDIDEYLTTWPTIGTLSSGADDEIWGFSPRAFANGSGFDRLMVIDPRSSAALMSYCWPNENGQSRWISSYAYDKLRQALGSGFRDATQEPTGGGLSDYVIVIGSIDAETEEVTLEPMVTVNGVDPGFEPGDVHVAILDGIGTEIASQDVFLLEGGIQAGSTDNPGAELSGASFVATIPLPGGSSPVAVVVEIDSQEVARVDASANPPTVQIDSPTGGSVASETIPLAWTAADLDGEPLRANVMLTVDGGLSWETLIANYEESAYDFPVRYLEGSADAQIRVLVSDGFHTTEAISDLFELDAGYPTVGIDIPVNGIAVPADGLLHLRGSGWDPEDGLLVGPALTWTAAASSPPGGLLPGELILGAGEALDIPASQLPIGCQIVTLTATDSDGRTATATVEVDIGETGCLGLFFADGFESGDFGSWSGTVP